MKRDSAFKRDDHGDGSRAANLAIDCDVGSASAVTTASAAIRPTSSRRPPSAPHGDHASDAIAVG